MPKKTTAKTKAKKTKGPWLGGLGMNCLDKFGKYSDVCLVCGEKFLIYEPFYPVGDGDRVCVNCFDLNKGRKDETDEHV
jgi:hypothetical protein